MNVRERPVLIQSEGEQLVGILCEPARAATAAVLVVVGGPQYRAGSHRQFVLLTRRLAAEGIAAMRFDCRGMGDSSGPQRTFEDSGPDIAAAIDSLLASCPGVKRVVLWALCDGASASLFYCKTRRDRRLAGIVLLNPWVRSEASEARTRVKFYYASRVLQRSFWRKLTRGDVRIAESLRQLARSIIAAVRGEVPEARESMEKFQDRMADGLRSFDGPVLLVLSGRDLTAKEFIEYTRTSPRWAGLLDAARVTRREVPEADHTFSSARWRGEVEALTLAWLREAILADE